MTRITKLLLVAAIGVPLIPVSSLAAPQARTYVSAQGNDANPCLVSSPCRTFQAALTLTNAGGEIFVLNSANYGAVTIAKAVTITSEGAVAGVLATTGVGITINAGASDVVNLRGLDIDGGKTGATGIQFSSGSALNIQRSVIRGFTGSGINFAPSSASSLFVSDTMVSNNQGNGILVSGGAAALKGALTRVTATGNGVGFFASGASVTMTVADAVASNNTYGIGANAAAVMVRNSAVSSNSVGIAADQNAIVRVGQSTVTANATGWQATNGGQTQSYGNNNVSGNTTDGTISTTVALQ
jgi:hypothetical protein